MAKRKIYGTQTFNNVRDAYEFIQNLELLQKENEIKSWRTIAKYWQHVKYYVVCYEVN